MYILFANILKYARFILKVMSVSFLATIDSRSTNGLSTNDKLCFFI